MSSETTGKFPKVEAEAVPGRPWWATSLLELARMIVPVVLLVLGAGGYAPTFKGEVAAEAKASAVETDRRVAMEIQAQVNEALLRLHREFRGETTTIEDEVKDTQILLAGVKGDLKALRAQLGLAHLSRRMAAAEPGVPVPSPDFGSPDDDEVFDELEDEDDSGPMPRYDDLEPVPEPEFEQELAPQIQLDDDLFY